MFFSAHPQSLSRPRPFGTLAGLGTLAGRTSATDTVLVGTRVRVAATIQDALTGIDQVVLYQSWLQNLRNALLNGGYTVLKLNSSYGEVVAELEVGIEKVSLNAIIVDFTRSVDYITDGKAEAVDVRFDVLYDVREHDGKLPERETTTPNVPDNKSIWQMLGLEDFSKESFRFLGGTITGATLAIGAGVLFFLWKR